MLLSTNKQLNTGIPTKKGKKTKQMHNPKKYFVFVIKENHDPSQARDMLYNTPCKASNQPFLSFLFRSFSDPVPQS